MKPDEQGVAMTPEDFKKYFDRIRPDNEWALKSIFVSFSDTPEPSEKWRKRYLPPPDDITSANYDEWTRDILRIIKDRAEDALRFQERHNIRMENLHNMHIRDMKWESGISGKGFMGRGVESATVAKQKTGYYGNMPIPQPSEGGKDE